MNAVWSRGDIPLELMTKRWLLAGALCCVITNSLSQAACGQGTEPQSPNPQQSPRKADQDSYPQPAPTPQRDAKKGNASSATADQSSTVGDTASSGPLNVKGKLRYFAVETFRPGIYPVAAFYVGLTMANPPKAYPPEWRQGLPGFARNYGDFMASWAAVQGGKFVAASLLHEDPRYFISTRKNFVARLANAVRYAVIDRSDSGRPRLAVANVAGAFAGGFVGNAYLPDPYANASHGFSRSALALTGFVTSNLADEFHPEIHRFAKKLHLPF
ncbi:MAG TPA: hypothetical protein VGJ51_17155 [Candidatus Angelobacter sp.]